MHQTTNYLTPMVPQYSVAVPKYMNTYRLESKKSFNCSLVYAVLEKVVRRQCFGVKYDSEKSASKVKAIAAEILQNVKKFEFDRYRLIVMVEIGANKQQAFETVVKFLWDASKDRFSTYSLKSGSMFTNVTCFGIYQD